MRILVVDDHALFREGVKHVLTRETSTLVDEAAGGGEGIEKSRQTRYDAIILDMSMPDRNGLDVLKQILAEQPRLPILIVSMHAEAIYATRALRAGAAGYMTKESAAAELTTAVAKILSGGRYVSAALAEQLADSLGHKQADLPHERLTDREFQVFRALAQGHSPREIATRLGLSIKTVNTHRSRILEKTGLRNTAALIHYAIEQGLI